MFFAGWGDVSIDKKRHWLISPRSNISHVIYRSIFRYYNIGQDDRKALAQVQPIPTDLAEKAAKVMQESPIDQEAIAEIQKASTKRKT